MNRSILDIIAATLHDEGRRPEEIYRFLLGQFVGTSYVWGGSGVCGTDCSGSVCASLSRAIGKDFRVTADGLYRDYFTRDADSVADLEGEIGAAFFLDKEGRAVHVAGYRGQGMFVNASRVEPDRRAAERSYVELLRKYPHLSPRLRVFPQERRRLLPTGTAARRKSHESRAV